MLKVKGIAKYIADKDARKNTLSSRDAEGKYYIVNGVKIPEKEFYEQYPCRLISANYKGENPDKTKYPK